MAKGTPVNKVEIRKITPDQARQMLKMNDGNRHMRMSYVKYLAAQMKAGLWVLSSDAIAIRDDGRIANGQHRLMAIVLSDTPIEVLFVDGITEAQFRVMDIGLKRTAADALHIGQHLTADAGLIARLMGKNVGRRVSHEILGEVAAWWSPVHEALRATTIATTRGLNNASIRLGVGVRWAMQGTLKAQTGVMEQYRALMHGDTQVMSVAVATLWKRQMRVKHGLMRDDMAATLAVSAWHHFDPKRADVEPTVNRPERALEEFVKQLAWLERKTEDEARLLIEPVMEQAVRVHNVRRAAATEVAAHA